MTNNILEQYTTVTNNKQVLVTVFKDGSKTIYGSFEGTQTSEERRHPRLRLKKKEG